MKKKNYLRRAKWVQSCTLVCVIFMLISLVRISAILPGLSEEDDMKKSQAKENAWRKEYTRGSILDRHGKKICWSEKPMGERKVIHSLASSGLLGYCSARYGTFGLEKTYDPYLTKSRSRKGEKKGADLTLTLDESIQEEAYRLIKDWEGSLVVLDAGSGEILALASSPSFDLNQL